VHCKGVIAPYGQSETRRAGVIFTPENGDGPGVKLRKAR
jgi:hypothetical protein